MVRDATRRITKYDGKIDADVIKSRFGALKDSMVDQATDQFALLVAKENAIKSVLSGYNVASIQIPFYLSFGRKLYGLSRKHTGETLTQEACITAKNWITRGLNPYIIQVIAQDVFGIDVSACTA